MLQRLQTYTHTNLHTYKLTHAHTSIHHNFSKTFYISLYHNFMKAHVITLTTAITIAMFKHVKTIKFASEAPIYKNWILIEVPAYITHLQWWPDPRQSPHSCCRLHPAILTSYLTGTCLIPRGRERDSWNIQHLIQEHNGRSPTSNPKITSLWPFVQSCYLILKLDRVDRAHLLIFLEQLLKLFYLLIFIIESPLSLVNHSPEWLHCTCRT